MKYRILTLLAPMIFFFACEDEEMVKPELETSYIQDNIFGCDQFEVIDIEDSFFSRTPPVLETFDRYFVYAVEYLTHGVLVIKDGFEGPVLQRLEMRVKKLHVFNNQLLICAEEGVFSLNTSGEISTISECWCYSMTLEAPNRLFLHGYFDEYGGDSPRGIFEYKNNTIVPFVNYPVSFDCTSFKLVSGSNQSLYVVSCQHEIAHYKNGVSLAEFDEVQTPFFPALAEAYEAYNGELIAIGQQSSDFYRIYRLVDDNWMPIYDLDYQDEDTEKSKDVFIYEDYNMLIHDDYLYAFSPYYTSDNEQGISRFDISGNEQKTWDDIDLVQIPGLDSRNLIDIVVANDGHAYAVLNKKIARITCE